MKLKRRMDGELHTLGAKTMKKAILLLALAGCVPRAVVEVPTVIELPPPPRSTIEDVKPTRTIQWLVERGDQEIERTMVTPYEFVYKVGGLTATVTLEHDVLTIDCSNGSKVDSYCTATPGKFTYVCEGSAIYPLVLIISCTVENSQGE